MWAAEFDSSCMYFESYITCQISFKYYSQQGMAIPYQKLCLYSLLKTKNMPWSAYWKGGYQKVLFLVQVHVQLRTEILRTSSLTQSGFELMTSRSWQYIPCHWDACSNHSAISDPSHAYKFHSLQFDLQQHHSSQQELEPGNRKCVTM